MSKSIKLKDNTYIDSSGVSYNRDSLKTTLDNLGSYTQVSGTYTTATWAEGTNTCVWTAPKTGLYLVFIHFQETSSATGYYKQFQMHGTSTRLGGNLLLWQYDTTNNAYQGTIVALDGCKFVSATAGQTVTPYIHTNAAGKVWNVNIVGVLLK